MTIDVEKVNFKRPNSDKEESGLMIGEFGRHIIIDTDMNIVINCSLEKYTNDRMQFNLDVT